MADDVDYETDYVPGQDDPDDTAVNPLPAGPEPEPAPRRVTVPKWAPTAAAVAGLLIVGSGAGWIAHRQPHGAPVTAPTATVTQTAIETDTATKTATQRLTGTTTTTERVTAVRTATRDRWHTAHVQVVRTAVVTAPPVTAKVTLPRATVRVTRTLPRSTSYVTRTVTPPRRTVTVRVTTTRTIWRPANFF